VQNYYNSIEVYMYVWNLEGATQENDYLQCFNCINIWKYSVIKHYNKLTCYIFDFKIQL